MKNFTADVTVPYFDDDFGIIGERATRGEDGKTYYVPANMTYNEWKETFVDGKKSKTASAAKNIEKGTENDIIISEKQLGKKIGKHAVDFGLSPSNEDDRRKMLKIIKTIIDQPDEIRHGQWRSQPDISDFYIKDNDVVVINNKKFVTILKGGVTNARIKDSGK